MTLHADLLAIQWAEELQRAFDGREPMSPNELRLPASVLRVESTVWRSAPERDEAFRLFARDLDAAADDLDIRFPGHDPEEPSADASDDDYEPAYA